jgi:hypothetical protein
MAASLRAVLARIHPMMGRALLKSFIDEVLPGYADAHRAKLRDLPSSVPTDSPAPESKPEPTQSFTSRFFAELPATVGDTSATVLVSERGASSVRRTGRTGAFLVVAVVAVAAVAVAVAFVARRGPEPDVDLAPIVVPVTTPVVDAGIATIAAVPVAPKEAAVANAVDAGPASASSSPAATHTAPSGKRVHHVAPEKKEPAKPVVSPVKPANDVDAWSKLPLQRKKDFVKSCQTPKCRAIQKMMQDGKDVYDFVMKTCYDECTHS